jgi:hypothetical protein
VTIPVTFGAAVRSAIRSRIAEWVDGEDVLRAAAGLPSMPVAWPGFAPEPAWASRRRVEVAIDMLEGSVMTTVGDADSYVGLGQIVQFPGTVRIVVSDQAGDGDGDLQEAMGRLTSFFTAWSYGSPQIEMMSAPSARSLPIDGTTLRDQWDVSFVAFGEFAMAEG